ncbi:hypothetical protein JCM3770_005900 [Rhodotorula araucariae]
MPRTSAPSALALSDPPAPPPPAAAAPADPDPDPVPVELEWGAEHRPDHYCDPDLDDALGHDHDDQPDLASHSDLADAAYLDPLALVNAWEGALADLKELHQERFLPPSDTPLTPTQKQAKAPFWYGPPASEASTSRLAPSTSTALPASFSAASLHARARNRAGDEPAALAGSDPAQPTKKRKRLTGSQKKARKAAKLAAGGSIASPAYANGGAGVNEDRHVGYDDEDDDDGPSYEPSSPPPPRRSLNEPAAYTPQSPDLAAPTGAGPEHPALSRALPCFPPAPIIGARAPSSRGGSGGGSGRGAGAERAFVVPPVASLPSVFPPPPTITPLTGREAPLEPETPEQLLEAALWSWFTAGYQTALLHAAAGVARFAPPNEGAQDGTE